MAFFPLFPFILLSLLPLPLFSAANLHRSSSLFRTQFTSQPTTNDTSPTTFFEVTKPIQLPNSKPCSYLLLKHDFASTYGKSPVLANFTPPSDCPSQKFSKIVLEWKATCKGRQFDRIFGVWLGGVEILRSCTAEPRVNGIVWTVEKDISRYSSLFFTNQTLAVYMGNLVDATYTGVYHVKLSIHFYPAEEQYGKADLASGSDSGGDLASGFDSGADLIIPISRNLPLNDGLWYEVVNSTDVESKELLLPQNAYRAVLEVYVSFHENDEFWYGNFPNDYISANNLTGAPGNGPFREVLVNLDGRLVGAVYPFTVVYTGGVNPLLWRPISAIGSFDLPTYDIEITPFLGLISDGKTHKIGFSVSNALNVWYIDANLHLWLDKKSEKIEGKLLEYSSSPPSVSMISNFTGYDGSFLSQVSRLISSTGWVKSSHGVITTRSTQAFNFSNLMVLGNEGNLQIVNQSIDFNDRVIFNKSSSSVYSIESFKRFPFYLHSDIANQGNGSYVSIANLTLGFNEYKVKASDVGSKVSSLTNLQKGQGSMLVKGNLVVSGLGSTQQTYHYSDDTLCYSRDVSSSNYTILYDKVSYNCRQKTPRLMHFGIGKWWSRQARRASLVSHIHVGKGGI